MKQFPKKIKALLTGIMYVAIYFAVSILVEMAYVLWQESAGVVSLSEITSNTLENLYAINVIATVVTFWVYLIIAKIRKEPFEKTLKNKKRPPIIYMMIVCLAVGMRFLVNVYYAFSQNIESLKQSIDTASQLTPEISGGVQLLIALFSAIVIAPIFEEILFRGLVMNEFLKVMRPWAAIVLQGIIFGVIHGVLFQSIFAAVLGILIGIVYYCTQSIKVSAVCHGVFNFSVIIAQSEYSLISGIIVVSIGIVLIAFSMGYIVSSCRKE